MERGKRGRLMERGGEGRGTMGKGLVRAGGGG